MIRKETTRFHGIATKSFASKKLLCNLWFMDEKAQATTLGFVIIMGIVLSATAIYFSMQIPEWTKEFEAEHASKVLQDYAKLGSNIDMALLSEDPTASAACPIGMAPESVQLVGIHASGGTLRFNSKNEPFKCIAYAPGEAVGSGNDSWDSTPADFLTSDKFHVDTSPEEGAKLQLATGEDRIYNSGEEEYLSGEFWVNNFSVTNNTTLYTLWLTVHAKNITIGPNSSINADGGGMAGGKSTGWPLLSESGEGEGGGEIPDCRHPNDNYCFCGAGGGGAGHYSTGGNGGYSLTGRDYFYNMPEQNHSGGTGGSPYGDATNISTTDAGSGGATAAFGQITYLGKDAEGKPIYTIFEGGFGGDGGSIIHLDAPMITIMGNVSVNGEDGHYSKDLDQAWDSAGGGGGGGSGGTILLKGSTIKISGNLSAKGGNGADGALACDHNDDVYDSNGGGGGGGGGGVIKIFYGINLNLSAPGGLTTHTNVSGGAGGHGGVGKSSNCSGSTTPKEGGDGSPGGDGLVYPESYPEYVESVPHYPTGFLISNLTGTQGHIGYINPKNTPLIRYGTMTWNESTPSGTNITLKVRTSMNPNMHDALPWDYCPEVKKDQDISDLPSVSNGHRYIQWRAELLTMDRSRTPVLKSVSISYEYGVPLLVNSSGSIQFSSQYLYLPNYKLVYEHGATIKSQREGEFMLFSPPFYISREGNVTKLKITSIDLAGDERTISGAFSSTVKSYYQDARLITGGLNFHNLTLDITTEHPTAWENWFNETCKDAGLTRGTLSGNYETNRTGNTVQIIFYGNESKPVNVWLKKSGAKIELLK